MALAVDKMTEHLPSVASREQAVALFEQEARRITRLSGKQFLSKRDAGDYSNLDDTPEGREIAYLGLLLPFGRQHS